MDVYQTLINQIEHDYSKKGHKLVRSHGTHLYGETPHKGKDTWHQEVFRPLTDSEIETLQSQVGMPLPDSLRRLYRVANGLRLFSDELTVYGLRVTFARTVANVWQPYSLVEPNTVERPTDATKDELVVGSYSFDGSLVKLNVKTGKVAACNRYTASETFALWPDLPTFLHKEYERLRGYFNDDLELIDPDGSTLPG